VVTGTTVEYGSGYVAFVVVVAVILAVVVLLSLRGGRRPVAPSTGCRAGSRPTTDRATAGCGFASRSREA